jgi:hypothetical protein
MSENLFTYTELDELKKRFLCLMQDCVTISEKL